MSVLLEVIGLILEILGVFFLLVETVEFRLKRGRLEVDVDEKSYDKRIRIRIAGITLLLIGFMLQLFGIVARLFSC